MTTQERLALDATIFGIVILAANPAITGLGVHVWLGLVLIVPALTHLVVNWEWVLHTIARLFAKLRAASRLNLVVDAALFGSLVAVTLSGFLVIPGLASAFGLTVTGYWHVVHLATSDLTVGLTLLHTALHWRWLANALRRSLSPRSPRTTAYRPGPTPGMPAVQTAPVRQPDRYPAARR